MMQWIFVAVAWIWAGAASAQVETPDALADALFMEALRAEPTLVSEDGVQHHVVRRFTDPDAHAQWRSLSEAERAAALSQARSWATARAAEDSALPIEAQVHLAGR